MKDSWLSLLIFSTLGTVTLRKPRIGRDRRGKQLPAFHVQVRQREECMKLEAVLRKTPVPHLREMPEILDHVERMLDLGTDRGVLSVLLPL